MSSTVPDRSPDGTAIPLLGGLYGHHFAGVAKGIRLYLCPLLAVAAGWTLAGQEPILRGDVDWVIGGVLDGDPAYLFDEVRALAQDAEGRVYVLDSGSRTVRVFEHRGSHLYSIGGPGEGPGEFKIRHLCGLALDPDGRLWVNQLISFEIFEVRADGGAYFGSLVVRDGATAALCGNPMFAGPTGITVPRRGRNIFGGKNEHVQVTMDGNVWGRVANFRTPPDFGEWEWPTVVVQDRSEGPRENFITPPFAARVFVASAPDGGFATAFSPVYDIGVHGPDGTEKTRLRRELLGPVITDAEAREGYEELARIRDRYGDGVTSWPELVEFPDDYRIPERKPVVYRMWYDDDGRLWVCLWPEEGDTMHRAHVYDGDGVFLHEAEWPRGITIWYGGLRGDVAVGVRKVEFDVEQVVRLIFRPQPAANPPGEGETL
ncbi:MAG: hypothetical protein OXG58_10695 [Gemmatimonadetes bacterium]|nr:hypothetical protein [Gemmatimonadota bacterium]